MCQYHPIRRYGQFLEANPIAAARAATGGLNELVTKNDLPSRAPSSTGQ